MENEFETKMKQLDLKLQVAANAVAYHAEIAVDYLPDYIKNSLKDAVDAYNQAVADRSKYLDDYSGVLIQKIKDLGIE